MKRLKGTKSARIMFNAFVDCKGSASLWYNIYTGELFGTASRTENTFLLPECGSGWVHVVEGSECLSEREIKMLVREYVKRFL